MNEYINMFEALGLTREEANTYMTCLSIWSNPVSTVAQKLGIKRQTCLYTIKKLESMGYISSYIKNGVNNYSAVKVEDIIQKHREKLGQIEQLLPEISSLIHRWATIPKVRYYQNEGISIVMDEILTQKTVCVLTNLEKSINHHSRELKNFRSRRNWEQIYSRIITYKSDEVLSFFDKEWKPSGDEYRFLKKDDFNIDNDIVIAENVVYILSIGNIEKYALVIEGSTFAWTQQKIFEILWSIAQVL